VGRRGILHGGSAYGCVFTGSADNNLFSFTSLTRPKGATVLNALPAFVVAGWVFVKSLTQTIIEVARAGLRLIADPLGEVGRWRWLTIKIGISVWVRQFFTLAVARDLYAGVPRIYVNYLDYDVSAHAFGPGSGRAMQSLRRVDSAIRQLWRVARRVPEHRYDLYVLSDHGQARCLPYRDVSGGGGSSGGSSTSSWARARCWRRRRPRPASWRDSRPPPGDAGTLPALPQLHRRGLPPAARPRGLRA
jgi:hypothetical protein